MARLFGILVLLLPLIEIALFVVVGQAIGVWWTLAAVLGTAAAGFLILRWLGLSMVNDIRNQVSRRELPGQAVADAMFTGVGALLLIMPGFFTDAVGLLLLLPPLRGLIYAWFSKRVQVVDLTRREYGYARRPEIDDGTVELDDDEWRPN